MASVGTEIKINGSKVHGAPSRARSRRRGCNLFAALLIAPCFGVLGAPSASAEFKVCNQTLNLYNVAIGTVAETGSFKTEGWWTLSANDCVSPIKEKLTSRFIYIFVTSIYGEDVLTGESTLCIDRNKGFELSGDDARQDCWLHDHEGAKFKEIDTRSADSWTVFIRETP